MKEIARLIIDAQGTERPVYSSKYTPEVPPQNVIVFPDKKEKVVDWRSNFDRLTELTKSVEAAEIVQEEGTYNVPITDARIPYSIGLIFSDAHIGSYTTDHELVRELLDKVLSTPNAFLLDAGDTFNNGVWSTLGYEDVLPPYMQAFTVNDIMRELGDKYGACVIGNHPEWMFQAGIKPEMIFAQQMKGPVFPGMGLLHLYAGDQKYDIALAHNYWGKSKKNIFNVCVNLRSTEYPRSDIFVVGHEHIWGHMKEKVDEREVLYVRPGTAKLRDRYARIHGIAKRGQECGIAVIFGHEEKYFEAFSLDEAVRQMELRRQFSSQQ